jgi:hypothetical protein
MISSSEFSNSESQFKFSLESKISAESTISGIKILETVEVQIGSTEMFSSASVKMERLQLQFDRSELLTFSFG